MPHHEATKQSRSSWFFASRNGTNQPNRSADSRQAVSPIVAWTSLSDTNELSAVMN